MSYYTRQATMPVALTAKEKKPMDAAEAGEDPKEEATESAAEESTEAAAEDKNKKKPGYSKVLAP